MGEGSQETTAFISYSHKDREYGTQVKTVFDKIGIKAFLAHEDLEVSDEWRERIIEELSSCDIFVPLLSENFLASEWAPQEAGFIISRLPDVIVAPLSIDGTIPCGFLSLFQSRHIPREGITHELLVVPLLKKAPHKLLPSLIRYVRDSKGFRTAEHRMLPLVPFFPEFTQEEAQALGEAAVKNSQIWDAAECKMNYLPEFIRVQGDNLKQETLQALRYQIENNKWYPTDVT